MFKYVLENLLVNKLRSFLSLLGILIGVGAVVALLSAGNMAANFAVSELKSMGSNLVSSSVYNDSLENINISQEQIQELSKINGVKHVSAIANWQINMDIPASVAGVDDGFFSIAKITPQVGRLLTKVDNDSHFCVIGQDVAEQLNKQGVLSIVGHWITIGDESYLIVGLLNKHADNLFIPLDVNKSILVPLNMARKGVLDKVSVRSLVLELKPDASISSVQQQLQSTLQQWFKSAKIFIRNPQELIKQIKQQRQSFAILLSFIAGIALLVGGIGIMNVMLVVLAERKQEVGLRMALGAKPADICYLFLIESALLSCIGGVIGIVFGLLAAYIMANLSNWTYEIFFYPIFLGLGLSCAVGLVFGLLPAIKGAGSDCRELFE